MRLNPFRKRSAEDDSANLIPRVEEQAGGVLVLTLGGYRFPRYLELVEALAGAQDPATMMECFQRHAGRATADAEYLRALSERASVRAGATDYPEYDGVHPILYPDRFLVLYAAGPSSPKPNNPATMVGGHFATRAEAETRAEQIAADPYRYVSRVCDLYACTVEDREWFRSGFGEQGSG